MIDASMVPDFTVEAREHLEKLESSLLKLESGEERHEILNKIFREMHTLKGAAQLVGISRIAELSHKLENLLDSLRQGKRDLDQSVINTLIEGKDRFSILISEIAKYQEEKTDISDLLARILEHDKVPGNSGQERENLVDNEIELTDDFREMFSDIDDIAKKDFTEDTDVIAALSDEEPIKEPESAKELLPELEQKLDSFFGEEISPPSPAAELKKVAKQPVQITSPAHLDVAALKREIENEEYDKELFLIFMSQLQENIAQLRILTDNLTPESDQTQHLRQCSDLISKLHSSANYMGYDQLTEFYGQWIAELEMIDLEMSTGGPVSFECMDVNIAKILEIFPDIEDRAPEAAIAEQTQEETALLPPAPSPSDTSESPPEPSIDEEEKPDVFKEMFSDVDDIAENDFAEDTTVIAALSDEEPVIEQDRAQEPFPGLEEKLDFFFGDDEKKPSPAPEQKEITEKPAQPSPPVEIDIGGLKDEIENEEYDDELFDIFIEQLQENISLLRTLSDAFSEETNKTQTVGQCSALISSLHSSANYMGYDRLSDFYGQWLAELDMIDLELATGSLISFDFMDINIAKVIEIFPQITDIATKEPLVQETPDEVSAPISPAPLPEKKPEPAAAAFTDEFEHIKAIFTDKEADDNEEDLLDTDTDFENIAPALLGEDEPEHPPSPRAPEPAEISPTADEQEAPDSVDFEPPQDDFPEADLRRQKLLKKLSGEIEALNTESDAPFKESTELLPLLQGEIRPDEYDNDLLEIYVKQVNDGISTLSSLIDNFAADVKKQPILDQCVDILESLRSSSNYMDYEHNEEFYRHWCEDVATSITELAAGESISLDYMTKRLSLVTRLFPHSSETPDDQPAPTVPPADNQQLFDKLSNALEKNDEELLQSKLGAALDEDDNQHLFDRLSDALDSSSVKQNPTTLKPIDDVINEILTGDGLAKTIPSPAESLLPSQKTPSPPIMDNFPPGAIAGQAGALKTDLRAEGADRRKHFVDRRRGIEDRRLDDAVETPQTGQSIRVNADKINSLMNQVGELVVSKSYISQLSNDIGALEQYFRETGHLSNKELKPLKEYIFKLNQANVALGRVSSEIQDGVMQVRMLPVEHLFKRYPRLVRDLVYQADKKINLVIMGGNTELDKTVIEEISDPLMHIVRNSIDHGIETVEERTKAGKEETATLRLEAYPDSSDIIIEITDDGRGIDPAIIKEKALQKNLFTAEKLDSMSEAGILQIIMTPGFTTAEKTTKTSGRGMGMDIAKTNIGRLNGTIDIESIVGHETMIRIRIPMTLAIIQALSIKVGPKLLTIPLTSVVETARIKKEDIATVEGIEIVEHRNAPLPILRLAEILNIEPEKSEGNHLYIAIVSAEGQRAGLIVDKLVGKDEAVIKPLAGYLRKESGFSGATIKGDGTISLILDIPTLLNIVKDRQITKHKKQALSRSLKGLAIT